MIKKAGFESQISELKEFTAKEKLEIVQPACRQAGPKGSLLRAGGGLGGIPPALQILSEICSNFFERTPQLENAAFSPTLASIHM
ncbi:hypothetical protein A2V47_04040 [Candidatus Atribacteria bacterium RBG_19FT_COMBO_35_14]|uniref:Uncharacterized protein n=1 Tax=Candidatus Sediminicultor quintus TaxID=1797291 RepID=A0A1F5AEZ0_9BACT|nr:MAG: hypothetical protein A2V47_04040 [Candidatus Atribacteria bacterium RBG_19FT_COMBO_35_14]